MPSHSFDRSWTVAAVCAAILAGSAPSIPHVFAARPPRTVLVTQQIEAARVMAQAIDCIKRLRLESGRAIDRALDPNETGLIGDEFTPLTTSLGEVEAKRTSTNPAFAALLVHYFHDAGLTRGDVVAVGASGSFPALLLATLSASRVLGLEPIVIYSMGASMYGANLPGFTVVEMLSGLRAEGILPYGLAAVSAGGDGDTGAGVLFDQSGATLRAEVRRCRLPVIAGSSLADSIARRLHVLETVARGRSIRCFVNIRVCVTRDSDRAPAAPARDCQGQRVAV
jgi:poly-gamma-glutamate system protein